MRRAALHWKRENSVVDLRLKSQFCNILEEKRSKTQPCLWWQATLTRIWKRKKKKKEKHISCHVPEKPKLTFHQTDKILQIHASIVCTIQSETAVDLLTLTLSWGQWVKLTVSILSPDPSQLPGPLEWCSSTLEQTRSDSYQTKHHEEEILFSFFMPPAMFQAVWSSLPKRGPSQRKKKKTKRKTNRLEGQCTRNLLELWSLNILIAWIQRAQAEKYQTEAQTTYFCFFPFLLLLLYREHLSVVCLLVGMC